MNKEFKFGSNYPWKIAKGWTGTVYSYDPDRLYAEVQVRLDDGHEWPNDITAFAARSVELI